MTEPDEPIRLALVLCALAAMTLTVIALVWP